MGRVTHFDVNVSDAARASAFYSAAFGWQITEWDGPMDYWFLITGDDGPGIDGGMAVGERRFEEPVLTLDIKDLDATLGLVTEHGGQLVSGPRPIQGVGMFAVVADTEGNQFGLMQEDPTA